MSVNTFMADLNATYTPGVNGTAGVDICTAMGGCAEAPATMVRTGTWKRVSPLLG